MKIWTVKEESDGLEKRNDPPPMKRIFKLVPVAGLEPARGCPHRILSATRLPFHHTGFFSFKTDRPWRGDLADNGGGEWI